MTLKDNNIVPFQGRGTSVSLRDISSLDMGREGGRRAALRGLCVCVCVCIGYRGWVSKGWV
jgi:hypothetical protein